MLSSRLEVLGRQKDNTILFSVRKEVSGNGVFLIISQILHPYFAELTFGVRTRQLDGVSCATMNRIGFDRELECVSYAQLVNNDGVAPPMVDAYKRVGSQLDIDIRSSSIVL